MYTVIPSLQNLNILGCVVQVLKLSVWWALVAPSIWLMVSASKTQPTDSFGT